MPIDPNEPTSDIGQMYRDYILSKKMPLTNANLKSVIEQSQREPGMIAGLNVQAPGPSAPSPPNIAGASSQSSGMPIPPPPPLPTPMPQGVQAPSMGPQVSAQPSTQPNAPVVPPLINQPPQTPPPGQAPGPNQVSQELTTIPGMRQSLMPGATPPGSAQEGKSDSGIGGLLGALGIGGAGLATILNRIRNGGDYNRPGSVPENMAPPVEAPKPVVTEITPKTVASAVNRSEPVPGAKTHPNVMPTAPGTHPNVMPGGGAPSSPKSEPSVASTIEKSVNTNEPAFLRRSGPQSTMPNLTGSTPPLPKQEPAPPVQAPQRKTTMDELYPPNLYPRGSAAFQSGNGGAPMQGPPHIGQPNRGAPVPEFLKRQASSPNYVQGVNPVGIPQRPLMQGPPNVVEGVRPIGPQHQGPPMGPGAHQGPPELTTVPEAPRMTAPALPGHGEPMTPNEPIGNILHPQSPPIEMLNGIPKGMEIRPRVRVRGVRG